MIDDRPLDLTKLTEEERFLLRCTFAAPGAAMRSGIPKLLQTIVDLRRKVERREEDLAFSERNRLSAEAARDLLYHERIGEVWCWTDDPAGDDLESLTCPVLIPAETLRRILLRTMPS